MARNFRMKQETDSDRWRGELNFREIIFEKTFWCTEPDKSRKFRRILEVLGEFISVNPFSESRYALQLYIGKILP